MRNEIDLCEYGSKGERYCPQCHARVSLRATACFMCGAPLYETKLPFWQRWLQRWARVSVIVALFLLLGLVAQLYWPRIQSRTSVAKQQVLAWAATATATVTPTVTPSLLTPTPTCTPTLTPTPTVTATPTAIVYTVISGDTMEQIALTYGVSVEAIKKANGLQSDFLVVGDRLFIPKFQASPQRAQLGSKTTVGQPNSGADLSLPANQDAALVLTPASVYPAPFLVWPLPGEQIADRTVYFAWTAPANLPSSAAYLLRIWGWPDGDVVHFWRTTNTLRLPRTALPDQAEGCKQFAWQVIIVRRPEVISNDAQKVLSSPSKTRRFSLP